MNKFIFSLFFILFSYEVFSQEYLNIHIDNFIKSYKIDDVDSLSFSSLNKTNTKELSLLSVMNAIKGNSYGLIEIPLNWNFGKYLQFNNGLQTESINDKESCVSDYIDISNKKDFLIEGGYIRKSQNNVIASLYDSSKKYISSIFPKENIFDRNPNLEYTCYIDSVSIPQNAFYMKIQSNSNWNCHLYYDTKFYRYANPYRYSKNFNKKIAIFGGSFSVVQQSGASKNIWRKCLEVSIDSYGFGGAGFALKSFLSSSPNTSIPYQIDEALASGKKYDVFILWASTNDFITNQKPVGTINSYTNSDSYNISELDTQCGGLNYSILKIRNVYPNAEIYFFGSLPFFSAEYGYNLNSTFKNNLGFTFKNYIDAQRNCCLRWNIPFLDQWSLSGVDENNYKNYYTESDNFLHPKHNAYEKWAWFQLQFIGSITF